MPEAVGGFQAGDMIEARVDVVGSAGGGRALIMRRADGGDAGIVADGTAGANEYTFRYTLNATDVADAESFRIQTGGGITNDLRIYNIRIVRGGAVAFELSEYLEDDNFEDFSEIDGLVVSSGVTATIVRDGGGQPPIVTPPIVTPPMIVPPAYVPAAPPAPSANAAGPAVVTTVAVAGGGDASVRVVGDRAAVDLSASAVAGIIVAGNVAEFDLSGLDIASASLPAAAIRQFANADMGIEVVLPQGVFELDADAVAVLAAQSHTFGISFRISALRSDQVPSVLAGRIPAGASVHQTAIASGSRLITNFEDAAVTVSLPAAAADSVWAVGTGGRITLPNGQVVGTGARLVSVNSTFAGGNATFETSRLGLFVVGN